MFVLMKHFAQQNHVYRAYGLSVWIWADQEAQIKGRRLLRDVRQVVDKPHLAPHDVPVALLGGRPAPEIIAAEGRDEGDARGKDGMHARHLYRLHSHPVLPAVVAVRGGVAQIDKGRHDVAPLSSR
jgi:hypothetical protein